MIDLRQCSFVDSTIVGAILATRPQDSSQEPTVSVVLPDDTSYVYRALSVIGLTDLVRPRFDRGRARNHGGWKAALSGTRSWRTSAGLGPERERIWLRYPTNERASPERSQA